MTAPARDYSLVGPEARRAEQRGLADGLWFQPNIDPARLRQLTERSNTRAAFDVLLWLALVATAATIAWNARDSWWAVPAFLVYGGLVGGTSDARWHECGHGTAFRTSWLNDLVYYPASFMLAREATYWRWSHFRHHTDTIIVGRDPEVVLMRPPSFAKMALTYSNLRNGPTLMWGAVKHAFGRIDPVTEQIVPKPEWRRVVWEARVYVAIWLAVIIASLATWSPWPLLFIGGPTIYGAWMMVFFGMTQHVGLQEDVLDHRYTTRTVRMNPLFRFLYLNMNYHVEHHLFPAVPYRALPALHAAIADQLPEVVPSTAAAYREILRAVRHQHIDPTWELPDRHVPEVEAARGQIVQAFEWIDVDSGWIDLGEHALEPGELRPVDVAGRSCVLACDDAGSVHLVDRRCTHGDADLAQGTVLGWEIECPKHNGRFDLDSGEPRRRPVTEPLQVHHVRVRNGRIETEVEVEG